jgi:hypothetical protein
VTANGDSHGTRTAVSRPWLQSLEKSTIDLIISHTEDAKLDVSTSDMGDGDRGASDMGDGDWGAFPLFL